MIARTGTPISLIAKTFTQVKINIPKAPALGLLLERVIVFNFKKMKIPFVGTNVFESSLACV